MLNTSGEYNFIHTSSGNNDECYTHRYAVEPLLEFLSTFRDNFYLNNKREPVIWCPFDDEDSEFVKVFTENGYKVVYSHIKYGQDFYAYEPEEWDILISNPPFTGKKQIFERALSFNKPFVLLMTVVWLNDATPMKLFKNKNLQLLMFEKRMRFKNQPSGKQISFSSAYFCHNFLPKEIIIRDFSNRDQMKLF